MPRALSLSCDLSTSTQRDASHRLICRTCPRMLANLRTARSHSLVGWCTVFGRQDHRVHTPNHRCECEQDPHHHSSLETRVAHSAGLERANHQRAISPPPRSTRTRGAPDCWISVGASPWRAPIELARRDASAPMGYVMSAVSRRSLGSQLIRQLRTGAVTQHWTSGFLLPHHHHSRLLCRRMRLRICRGRAGRHRSYEAAHD